MGDPYIYKLSFVAAIVGSIIDTLILYERYGSTKAVSEIAGQIIASFLMFAIYTTSANWILKSKGIENNYKTALMSGVIAGLAAFIIIGISYAPLSLAPWSLPILSLAVQRGVTTAIPIVISVPVLRIFGIK